MEGKLKNELWCEKMVDRLYCGDHGYLADTAGRHGTGR
jgi:hypothetical protein